MGVVPAGEKGPVRANYLALPSRDLAFLKNTLRLYLREDKVAEVVQAFGARCGAGQVLQSQVEVRDAKELGEVIPAMSAQIGLAKIKTRESGDDHLLLELSRVAEAASGASRETRMEFTRGFLVGAVSELLQRRVVGKLLAESDGPDRAVLELRWILAATPTEGGVAPLPGPGVPVEAPKGRGTHVLSGALLLESGGGVDALTLFASEARRRGGLAITAEHGKELRSRRDLSHVRVYDLVQGEGLGLLSLEAGNLPAMLNTVDEFIKRVPSGVVLLSDLPMLLSANGVEPTRNFLSIIGELLAEGKGALFACTPSGGIGSGDRALLLRTLKVYSPP